MSALPFTTIQQVDGRLSFAFDRQAYRRMLGRIPTRDLVAELEHARYLAVECLAVPGDSRAVAEVQVQQLADELARRQRLQATGDRLLPRWPDRDMSLSERVDAVREAWPIERMADLLLGCQLMPAGRGRWKARCPFHDERTPSFTVFAEGQRGWCFGCNQGGDIFDLVGLHYGYERFYDKLACLERFAGIAPRDGQA
jgi:hypothetical protein